MNKNMFFTSSRLEWKTAVPYRAALASQTKRKHHEQRRARQENEPTHRQVLGRRRLQAKAIGRPGGDAERGRRGVARRPIGQSGGEYRQGVSSGHSSQADRPVGRGFG